MRGNYWSQLLEFFSIIVSLSATLVFIFYLLIAYDKPIIFTEPSPLIRITEIAMGFISIVVLIKILIRRIPELYSMKSRK